MPTRPKHKASVLEQLKNEYHRFGLGKSLLGALDRSVNQFLHVDCLKIRVLERKDFKRPQMNGAADVTCRNATLEDLLNMQDQGNWEIGESKIKNFLDGDLCVLSFVGSQPAGYTWLHLKAKPFFFQNLRIQIPEDYIYTYASFTASRYRGKNLMLYRRGAMMNNPAWKDKTGLFSYVKATNWSSLRGQDKSRYQTVGTMWLVRLKKRYFVWFSHRLRAMGVKRIALGPAG